MSNPFGFGMLDRPAQELIGALSRRRRRTPNPPGPGEDMITEGGIIMETELTGTTMVTEGV